MGLSSLKSVEQSSKPETQGRVDIIVLSPNFTVETQGGFLCCSLETKLLLLWETSVFALNAFN